ncbi:MAG: efflux RND transporter periplasmic adaptor subunit, partial [Planctomycetes bacterium]|nr:efflux RND transporter periplasmic adaptor subunit [Planctomycetota bacterium]
MASCTQIDGMLQAYVDQALGHSERLIVDHHVEECQNCRRLLKRYQHSSAMLFEALSDHRLKLDLTHKVLDRLPEMELQRPDMVWLNKRAKNPTVRWDRTMRLVPVAAAVLLIVMGAVIVANWPEAPIGADVLGVVLASDGLTQRNSANGESSLPRLKGFVEGGESYETASGASLMLGIIGSTYLKLNENTRIKLVDERKIFVETGEVFLDVGKAKRAFKVLTPSGEITVLGTAFDVSVKPDSTRVVVEKGDHLALVYSPRLYSGQVELLLAKQAREDSRSTTFTRVIGSNRDLYQSSKQRLIELGMTAPQIEQLERTGEANSRVHLCAPISGTVIEKFAVEGQYVKEGQAIYKLADLSTVWLMLELFPEDAATIRYGQKVEAVVQSLPGRKFTGRVAFIDPSVDPKTRTVGVRVVIPNGDGLLRVGDYAKATLDVPVTGSIDQQGTVYDPELANKWISPRHPHVVESSAGKCRICGVDLVPAARFGFTAEASANGEALVVPRDAVLMAGSNSVLYVETEPGRFEIRRVVLGPSCGDQIVILSGVKQGEQVATRGNFLIDSQMQLAGNPSLIDPTKAEPKRDEAMPAEVIAALSKLSTQDRGLAESQRICPVTMMLLGSMGTPKKVDVNG